MNYFQKSSLNTFLALYDAQPGLTIILDEEISSSLKKKLMNAHACSCYLLPAFEEHYNKTCLHHERPPLV